MKKNKVIFKKLNGNVSVGITEKNRTLLFMKIKYKKKTVKLAIPVISMKFDDEGEVWAEKEEEIESNKL